MCLLLYPEYQRQGLGTELMKRVLAGCEHVQNTVLLSDRGNEPFYERFGFQVADNPYYQAMTKHGPH